MDDDAQTDDNKRSTERVRLDLPIQARVGEGDHLDLEIVDMSATGMQVRTENFDVLKGGFDSQHNQATFEIKIEARLAWARPEQDGTFVTGWEFDRDTGEELIG
jgi:hypothetical protein